MKNPMVKAYTKWWRKYLKVCPPLISDWVKKETIYLSKNIKKGSIILDVGCGWGDDIKSIASIVRKAVGIDNDPGAIRDAKKNLSKLRNVGIFLEDAKKMHFDNNIFESYSQPESISKILLTLNWFHLVSNSMSFQTIL